MNLPILWKQIKILELHLHGRKRFYHGTFSTPLRLFLRISALLCLMLSASLPSTPFPIPFYTLIILNNFIILNQSGGIYFRLLS